FETLNTGEFEATAALFAPTGELKPPFEDAIVGPEAIATYLEAEAQGLRSYPRQGEVVIQEDDTLEVQVRGKVRTSVFTVNVAWQFVLNPQRQITYARIKLLASPQELLNLRQNRKITAN
ncbi:MAG: nuclear transport factor 2 family protein, partial [Jaaginema sp. PMC 1078.18]|nr:nuclear transport factor 2 family protein [Jaaginema sp. PMC 1078.18]